MRHLATVAGWGVAVLALSGCALVRPPCDRLPVSPSQDPRCQQLSQTAQAALDHQDYEPARVNLEALVAQAPRSAEAHQRLGRVLQLEGRLVEAEAEYHRALALEPEYVGALIGLGQVEARLGRPASALERFDAAVDIDPHQPEAHCAQGQVLEALGRTDEALAAYFRALEYDPVSAPVSLRVAALQLARRQPDQALARLDQILELNPDDPEARHQRGRAHLALNHPRQAVADLQLAARRLPGRADVLYHLALAYQADHRTQAALDAATRALAIAPDFADARALSQLLRR